MNACANATELYWAMHKSIQLNDYTRTAVDGAQPNPVQEAQPGLSFTLRVPWFNVVGAREIDRKWAVANALHFFAATEEAPLEQYNKLATKFAPDGRWRGAYGAIAMSQIQQCIALLREHPDTRRAIVSMGGFCEDSDLNRPACWSFLQFLHTKSGLELLCYQRSLNLYGVMPYDCVVLTNILYYVSLATRLPVGPLRWLFGSLHTRAQNHSEGNRNDSIMLPYALLSDPKACLEQLKNPTLEALLC